MSGTGTGWLAIALARAYPEATVTGIDLFAPALELARVNVAAAGLTERVELRLQNIATLDEHETYDAVWLPMPFLPKQIVPDALDAASRAIGAYLVIIPGALARLGTVRRPLACRPSCPIGDFACVRYRSEYSAPTRRTRS